MTVPFFFRKGLTNFYIAVREESEVPIVAAKRGNSRGAKGHYFRNVCEGRSTALLETTLQEVPWSGKPDEERVRDFQRKLYRKVKEDKGFRFYVLYDKVRLPHMLREAYRRCRAKQGAPGVDGQTFDDIEQTIGTEAFLATRGTFRKPHIWRRFGSTLRRFRRSSAVAIRKKLRARKAWTKGSISLEGRSAQA
jgi:hypothetical protein